MLIKPLIIWGFLLIIILWNNVDNHTFYSAGVTSREFNVNLFRC